MPELMSIQRHQPSSIARWSRRHFQVRASQENSQFVQADVVTRGDDQESIFPTVLICSLLEQQRADAIGPGANGVPVPVIALRPNAQDDAQAKHQPIAK